MRQNIAFNRILKGVFLLVSFYFYLKKAMKGKTNFVLRIKSVFLDGSGCFWGKKTSKSPKNVEKKSQIYKNQLRECRNSLDRKKYIIF